MQESEHIRIDVAWLCFTTTVLFKLKKVFESTNVLFSFFSGVMS